MEEFDFQNKYTKKIHMKFLKKDKDKYEKFIESLLMGSFFDDGDNEINRNMKIELDCFQVIELYTRSNIKKIEKMFYGFVRLIENRQTKYSKLRSEADKTIKTIIEKVDHSYMGVLNDFVINCNLQYIKYITMSINCVGPNLFRMIYNCYLTDFAMYKYWLLSCPKVNKLLEITPKYRFGKTILNFSVITGNQRKRDKIKIIEHNIYIEINKYIQKIAPGILTKIYKKIPCSLVASYEKNYELLVLKDYVIEIPIKKTSFFDTIIRAGGHNDRYIDKKYGNVFVPLNFENNNNDILMKQFRTNTYISPVQNLAWINIVYFLLYNQRLLIESMKNMQYENDIYGKNMNTSAFKKKLRKIIPTLELLKSSYESEKFYYENPIDNSIQYVLEFGNGKEMEYFSEYRKHIDILMNSLEKEIKNIKEVYLNNYNEINININKRLQWIAVFIALIALFQAYFQCSIKKEGKNINDTVKYEYNETLCENSL
jgi:hypothetical protein